MPDTFRKLTLSFPDRSEEPYFVKTLFRVKDKIFALYNCNIDIFDSGCNPDCPLDWHQ